MSYMDRELQRMADERSARSSSKPKEGTSLLSRLKKGMAKKVAIGATVLTTAAAGLGVYSYFQGKSNSESNEARERAASIEYRVKSTSLHLPEKAFTITSSVDFSKMTGSQLKEYGAFAGGCARYLKILNQGTGINFDPAKRLGEMYEALDQKIEATGNALLHYGESATAVDYQILQKIKEHLHALEPTIKSGKSRAERFDNVKDLYQMAESRATDSVDHWVKQGKAAQKAASVRHGDIYDF